ncbi:MAG: gamma-glutamylcyclotransferase (GGCT)/AIG2-like uncharacterized protein YtfP [Planctomycetota bacterium]|jgi:gamma-glutamylcyclotransferase (GGCT)/AIG2-like uncharacterized protein YtfP
MDVSANGGPGQPDETLVFVYGTLQRGESNHDYLGEARFLGEARTAAQFDLVDLGDFPAMVDGGDTQVDGELYALKPSRVRTVDELEDHPEYFRRTAVELEDGTSVFSYILSKDQGHPYPRIASGSWRNSRG